MNRMALFAFITLVSSATGQNYSATTVIISKLSPPTYPKLALQARITGIVELKVALRPDGGVESITVIDGHPMLKTAASESAQKTVFECKDCREPSTLYRITYKFELGDPLFCNGIDANGHALYDESADTQVNQSEDAITVRGRPFATCDPTETISFLKFRSGKCLYLWRCAKRPLQ